MKKYSQHAGMILAIYAMAVMLTACGTFAPKVDSAGDAVAVTYASIESGAELTTDLLVTGSIDAEQAKFAKGILDRSMALAAIAEREVLNGRPDEAQAILATVSRLLMDLQVFIGREF